MPKVNIKTLDGLMQQKTGKLTLLLKTRKRPIENPLFRPRVLPESHIDEHARRAAEHERVRRLASSCGRPTDRAPLGDGGFRV